jgi:predicted permease
MEQLLADLRHAVRRLGRAPAFALISVVTLALGIGANTAIFSLVSAVLLRPLPYEDADRVVMLWTDTRPGETTWLSAREITTYGDEAKTLQGIAGATSVGANLTGGDEPERVIGAAVTPNAFPILGVDPQLGRAFVEAEGAPGGDEVVVLGHGLWQRRFGGAPDIVGQVIQVNGRPRTVVGIMPAGFRLPLDYREERPSELWIPLVIDRANPGSWGNRGNVAFARLAPGVTPERASAELDIITHRWIAEGYLHEQGDRRWFRQAVPVRELLVGDVRRPMLILFGAVGLVLLIACANVANLMLARGDERRREIAIRTALGAARGRVIRQLLAESLVLAAAGAALGTALAWAGTRALIAIDPAALPRVTDARLDAGVLAFTTALALLTGILFGLAPALQLSRPELTGMLRDGGRGGTAGRARQRFRRGLAVVEMAFSVILLVGAMLLVRSLIELRRVDLGFAPRGALTARLTLPTASYPGDTNVVAFYEQLLERLGQLPGVGAVAATRILPLTGTIGDWSITLEGQAFDPRQNPNGDWQVVTPGYFETMRISLVRGRTIARTDHAGAPVVAVINETMAERYWPGGDAIGRRFHLGTNEQPWVTIVGIARTVRHNAVLEEPRAEMYLPHAQFPVEAGFAPRAMTVVLRGEGRTASDPLALAGPLRAVVRQLDPNLPLADVRTLEQVTNAALAPQRFTTTLLGLFAALAVVLAAIGIYGLISLLVAQRTNELGIRMALGARGRTILAMVLGQGMAIAAAGVALGLAGALALTRLLEKLVYGVTTLDPLTFTLVPVLLGGVALFACAVPARRAAAVDPAVALRQE